MTSNQANIQIAMNIKISAKTPALFLSISISLFLLIVISGCVSNTSTPLVSREADLASDKVTLVFSMEFVEEFNNIDWKEVDEDKFYDYDEEEKATVKIPRTRTKSDDLLRKKLDRLLKSTKDNPPEKIAPIHYIRAMTAGFLVNDEKVQDAIRYHRYPKSYDSIGIHQIDPGNIKWNAIRYHHLKWENITEKNAYEYIDYLEAHFENFGEWNARPGDIIYIGHLMLHYKSYHYLFGMLFPKEVTMDTKLVRATISNRYQETIDFLKAEKQWFPASRMIDGSHEGDWEFEDLDIIRSSRSSIF